MNREKNIHVAALTLRVIGAAGLLAVALVAPNVLKLGKGLKKRTYNTERYINQTLQKFLAKKWVRTIDGSRRQAVTLTERGRVALLKYQSSDHPPKPWDKKWRVLMFDVWETDRAKRDALRNDIKQAGFVQLQKSVWVYPYECSEFVELLKADYHFGKNVRYMEVNKLDDDIALRKHFKLPHA